MEPKAKTTGCSPLHWSVWLIAAATLGLHLITAEGYGIFRDELYYLACGEHPGWGYVDHPPMIGWLAWVIQQTLGTSLLALRLLPAAFSAAGVVVAGVLARELGGRGWAQAVAALCVAVAPMLLALHSILSMNALDVLLWSLAGVILVRIERTQKQRLWLLFGVLAGVGLLNKLSFLFLGFGVVVGLLAARRWQHLRSSWLWLGGAVAALIFAPHVIWQVVHGWPTLEFIENAASGKIIDLSALAFFGALVRDFNPLTAPLWLGGLLGLVVSERLEKGRVLGWTWLVVFVIMAFGSAKPYYLAPAFPWLFAAGTVMLEGWSTDRMRWARVAVPAVVLVTSAAMAPLAKPLLPVKALIAYQQRLGLAPSTDERHQLGRLSQLFADMHGWREMAESVARAMEPLPAEVRERACVFGRNYGEAGAIDLFGPELGLPPAISGHNSYWLWGPGECSGEVVVVIGGDRDDLEQYFDSVEAIGVHDARYAMPYERNLTIWLARGMQVSLAEAWPQLKHFR
jgi:4-amino-4-deoxy-L-arabinose transferase-like glycosyltransferase